jgi:hypothetical protein
MKKTVARIESVNMGFRRRCRNKVGGLDLEIMPLNEKMPHGLDNPGPKPEVGFPGSQSALFRSVGTIL